MTLIGSQQLAIGQEQTLDRGLTWMGADQENTNAMVGHSRGRLCHTSFAGNLRQIGMTGISEGGVPPPEIG
jgi:hypothetical protein